MPRRLYANNARCKLGADIVTTGAIATIILETGKGGLFPLPTGGDYFHLTVEDSTKETEIFVITTRTGDICSVSSRGAEGTVSKTFTAATSICGVRPTKQSFDDTVDHLNETANAHPASAIGVTPTGALVATDVQAALAELDADLTAHIVNPTAAHAASAISVVPAGDLGSTTVQLALEELQTDIDASEAVITDIISGAQIVGNATRWNGSAKTVSTSGPSGGADGDIWFQY